MLLNMKEQPANSPSSHPQQRAPAGQSSLPQQTCGGGKGRAKHTYILQGKCVKCVLIVWCYVLVVVLEV